MARRFSRRRPRKPVELLLVPMIDIFTVLVTFLLMTAVFSRIAILELDLPSSASGGFSEPEFRLEVIVRREGIELANGAQLIAAIPKRNGAHDLATLSELALSLKSDHPDAMYASVLLEPDTAYDDLIQVMDAVRSAELPVERTGAEVARDETRTAVRLQPERIALFTEIAVGDAP
ncbi:MAG: ExbD/TolR family protein [Myxococcota bacterium]